MEHRAPPYPRGAGIGKPCNPRSYQNLAAMSHHISNSNQEKIESHLSGLPEACLNPARQASAPPLTVKALPAQTAEIKKVIFGGGEDFS